MKKLLFILFALVIAVPVTRAYTIDQLLDGEDEAYFYEVLYGNYKYNTQRRAKRGGCFKIKKVDDSHVIIEDMMDYNFKFKFTLVNNYGTTTTGSQNQNDQLAIPQNDTDLDGRGFHIYHVDYSGGSFSVNTSDNFSLRIKKSGTEYYLAGTYQCCFAESAYALYANMIFYDIQYFKFTPNAIGTSTVAEYECTGSVSSPTSIDEIDGTRKTKTYPVLLDINNSTGSFSILNFGNFGKAINSSGSKSDITGTIDFSTGKVTFTKNQTVLSDIFTYSSGWSATQGYVTFNLSRFSTDKFNSGELYGEYEEGVLSHTAASDNWASNGGSLTTNLSSVMTIEDFSFYTTTNLSDYMKFYYNQAYLDNKIQMLNDVTLDVSLNIDSHGVDNNRLYVHGYINENGNLDYVDSYELYVVPGHLKSVSEFTDHLCNTNGHKHALNISGPQYDLNGWYGDNIRNAPRRISAASIEGNSIEFNKMVPMASIENKDAAGKYTFFIKANYKSETNLEPTFHSLTYADITTGLDQVESRAAEVRAESGRILILNTAAEAAVYTPGGALVYQGLDRTVPLAPGVYIVRVAGTVSKVVVK